MPKCTVTLNPAITGVPYVGHSMVVADVVARDDGAYWTTTQGRTVPLANSPLATIDLDQGEPYSYVLPDGSADVRLTPNTATAKYSELDVLRTLDVRPDLVLVLDPTVVTSTDGLEPAGLSVGDYWIVNNPYLPTHGDLNQKTS